MRKIILVIAVVIGALVLTAAGFFFYIIHFVTPRSGEMVSLSAPPEGDTAATPYFAFCDSIPCSCACDDPFDPRLRPDTGIYKGLCLNTCHLRSAKLLDSNALIRYGYFKPDADMNTAYAANIYHMDSLTGATGFFVGRIPIAGVNDAIYQVEYAGGIQGHSQMRFRFAPDRPVTLVPQRTDAVKCTLKVWDLYCSVEANSPPGTPYKGDYGFRQEYFQTYRIATQYSRASCGVIKLHRSIWQYRIKLTNSERKKLLVTLLEMAAVADPNERYHTTRNNCVLALFVALDKAVPPAWYRRPLIFITDNTLFIPTRGPKHLRYRGRAARNEADFHLQNLETELGWEEYVNNRAESK